MTDVRRGPGLAKPTVAGCRLSGRVAAERNERGAAADWREAATDAPDFRNPDRKTRSCRSRPCLRVAATALAEGSGTPWVCQGLDQAKTFAPTLPTCADRGRPQRVEHRPTTLSWRHLTWQRSSHNPEVAGSNPAPATSKGPGNGAFRLLVVSLPFLTSRGVSRSLCAHVQFPPCRYG